MLCLSKCLKQSHQFRTLEDFCEKFRINSGRNRRCRCCRFRWCHSFFSLIKGIFNQLRIVHAILIQDVRILVGNHLCLRVTGVTLNGFDITAVQLQLISDTGMTQRMEDNRRKTILLDQFLHAMADRCSFGRHTKRSGEYQVVILILITKHFFTGLLEPDSQNARAPPLDEKRRFWTRGRSPPFVRRRSRR